MMSNNFHSTSLTLFLNGQLYSVGAGVLLAALLGVRHATPSFCYSSGLEIAGNCRMCTVAVAGAPDVQVSCSIPCTSGLTVDTDSALTCAAREMNLSFMLANHPLDCPVCDQGGECDLQDFTYTYGGTLGADGVRARRPSLDFGMDLSVRTSMDRCIVCTKCVRMTEDVSWSGSSSFCAVGRGSNTQIGSGTSSANLRLNRDGGMAADVCPVGFLHGSAMILWCPDALSLFSVWLTILCLVGAVIAAVWLVLGSRYRMDSSLGDLSSVSVFECGFDTDVTGSHQVQDVRWFVFIPLFLLFDVEVILMGLWVLGGSLFAQWGLLWLLLIIWGGLLLELSVGTVTWSPYERYSS